jgi:acetyl-CoA/propionyl-CoA carboxylase biotin carboxyl carrier protein
MMAKLIVTGASREEALERSRRALSEMQVNGLPTVIPFHRLMVDHPAFTAEDGFKVFTRWIETEWENPIEPWTGQAEPEIAPEPRREIVVEVSGKRLEVSVPKRLLVGEIGSAEGHAPKRKNSADPSSRMGVKGDSLVAPMQATVVKLAASEGAKVEKGDLVVVLEAMKMEQPLVAHKSGTVSNIGVAAGATISAGTRILDIL